MLLAGFVVSVAAARMRFFSLCGAQWVLDILFLLPLAIPYVALAKIDLLTEYLFLLSLFYFAAVYGFSKVDRTVLDAARMHGMGVCGTFWRVFFPAARKFLCVAFLLGLCRLGVYFYFALTWPSW